MSLFHERNSKFCLEIFFTFSIGLYLFIDQNDKQEMAPFNQENKLTSQLHHLNETIISHT